VGPPAASEGTLRKRAVCHHRGTSPDGKDIGGDTVERRNAYQLTREFDTLAWAVRGGLLGCARVAPGGGWVAVRLILTSGSGGATGKGALGQLAGDISVRLTMAVTAVGFAARVVWPALTAAVGYRNRDGRSRYIMRVGAVYRAVVWGYLAVTTTEWAIRGGSAGSGSPSATTATAMS
jgi:hypothetical protein